MTAEERVFRAIAHPTRRNMLHLLAVAPLSVKDLTSHFDMSQPAISQHLKELREAELVASDRLGSEQRYRLTPQPLRYVMEWSERYRSLIDPVGHAWAFVPHARGTSTRRSTGRRNVNGR